jgi:hypothetical protein
LPSYDGRLAVDDGAERADRASCRCTGCVLDHGPSRLDDLLIARVLVGLAEVDADELETGVDAGPTPSSAR